MRKSARKSAVARNSFAVYAVQPAKDGAASERVIPLYAVRAAEDAERRIVMAALGADLCDDSLYCSLCAASDCSNVTIDGIKCAGL